MDPAPDPALPARGQRKAKWFRHLSASSLGIEIAVAIVLGWWAGRWLERNVTHWGPWTTYLGFFAGCGAAIVAITRTVREYKTYLAELEAEKADNAAEARRTESRARFGADSETEASSDAAAERQS